MEFLAEFGQKLDRVGVVDLYGFGRSRVFQDCSVSEYQFVKKSIRGESARLYIFQGMRGIDDVPKRSSIQLISAGDKWIPEHALQVHLEGLPAIIARIRKSQTC